MRKSVTKYISEGLPDSTKGLVYRPCHRLYWAEDGCGLTTRAKAVVYSFGDVKEALGTNNYSGVSFEPIEEKVS